MGPTFHFALVNDSWGHIMCRGPGAQGSSGDVWQVQVVPRVLEYMVLPASPEVSSQHEASQTGLAVLWPHHPSLLLPLHPLSPSTLPPALSWEAPFSLVFGPSLRCLDSPH